MSFNIISELLSNDQGSRPILNDLTNDQREKLTAVLTTVRFFDVREQAFSLLFNKDNSAENIEPYNLKMMVLSLLRLVTNLPPSQELRQSEKEDFDKMLNALFIFFDTLDCEDYQKIRDIEEVLEYGDETPEESGKRADFCHTAESVYNTWVGKPAIRARDLLSIK